MPTSTAPGIAVTGTVKMATTLRPSRCCALRCVRADDGAMNCMGAILHEGTAVVVDILAEHVGIDREPDTNRSSDRP